MDIRDIYRSCELNQQYPYLPKTGKNNFKAYTWIKSGYRHFFIMRGGRRVRSSASERACFQCQKRKTRCVPNDNGSDTSSCSYCAKMSKACVFETPPTRTPLTRRNLDAVEARCKELELRLRQLQPATKTKAAAASSGQKRDAAVVFQEQYATRSSPHSASAVRKPVESPAELGFEWQEVSSLGNNQSPFEEKRIQDGMVSLAASGYSGRLGWHRSWNNN